ncbi:AraC family transcriptional regulator ligand-binding domain-containing protein [bacterium SCSIO 12741]|nr:AraC family transcriptional regulator ligand-binding domain-containing protein [bacterium SCSIO 12741]
MAFCDKVDFMFFAGSFVLDLEEFSQQRGWDALDLFELTGMDSHELRKAGCTVDFQTIERIFKKLKGPQSEYIGLEMGDLINLRATAFVDQIMESCSTVQEAFEFAIGYSRLISDSMDCQLSIEEDQFEVTFALHPKWSLCDDFAIRQNLELALLCAQKSLQRLTEKKYHPKQVNFHFPKTGKPGEYFRRFNCPVRFNQAISSIVFERHVLEESALGQNLGLRERLTLEADSLLHKLPLDDPWSNAFQKSILTRLAQSEFQIEAVASDLHLSPRTLQRRLKEQGKTFKQAQNELRFQLVKKLMQHHRYSLDEVAWMTGFSEASTLIRAFKNFEGVTPKQFQIQQETTT